LWVRSPAAGLRPTPLTFDANNMSFKYLIVVLILGSLCIGCSSRAKISKLDSSSVVIAFGDSLTHGSGADIGESYPALLSQSIGCRVVNAGVPGEDSTDGLSRLEKILKKERPDLVILCHGGNDMLRQQDQDITSANLRAMISLARDTGSDVILIGVPKPGLRLKTPDFYEDIAKEYDIPFIRDTIADVLSTPSLKSDRIHPNAEGYKRVAESIAELIENSQRN